MECDIELSGEDDKARVSDVSLSTAAAEVPDEPGISRQHLR